MDFAAIAAAFAQLAYQDAMANTAGRRILAVLEQRAAAARAAEAMNRNLPTLRFEGGALAVLALPRFPDAARAGLPRFIDVGIVTRRVAGEAWDRWTTAYVDVTALIEAADRLTAAVDRSADGYARPTPDQFDPRGRTILDLVGVAAAFFSSLRTANAPGGDIDVLCKGLGQAAQPFASQPAAAPAAAAGGLGAALPVPAAIGPADEPDAVLLAGLVLFASLPSLLALSLEAVDLRVRLTALEALQRIERVAYRTIAATYHRVFGALSSARVLLLGLVRGLQVVVGAYARGLMAFAIGFGTGFARAIRDFVYQLAHLLRAVVTFVDFVVGLLETVGLDRWVSEGAALPQEKALAYSTRFPDIASTLFGADVRRRVVSVVEETDQSVRSVLTQGLAGVADHLQATGARFAQLADQPMSGRLPAGLPGEANALVTRLFPPEAGPARDPVAEAMGRWTGDDAAWIGTLESLVAGGGMGVVVAVLNGYAREVARQWHARLSEDSTMREGEHLPTSPHILRRHGQPRRVQLPRVLVRVAGSADDSTLDQIADELATTVVSAYRQGSRRLATGAGR